MAEFPRRAPLPTQPAAQRERWVRTDAELRSAIGAIAQGFDSTRVAPAVGSAIIIAAPFRVIAPIVIPGECPCLSIRATARFPIIADGVISTMFDVRAELFDVSGLYVFASDTTNYFTTFVTMTGSSTSGRSANFARIHGCHVTCDRILVDASSSDADDGALIDVHQQGVNGSHSVSVYIDSPRWRVIGCDIDDGGGDSIELEANAESCRIVGNDLGGGDYRSTGSNGFNTFSANVRVGAGGAAHASDDLLGGNTA